MRVYIISGRHHHYVPLDASDNQPKDAKAYRVYCARPAAYGGDVVVEIKVTRPKRGKGRNRSTAKPLVVYDEVSEALERANNKEEVK